MAAYEILLLNTAIPQIQAAQSGDTYVVPRDIAFSAALTLSAGTANGVPYLNGSKVVTTGSALTFDGTTFSHTGASVFATSTGNVGIGTGSPDAKLRVIDGAGNGLRVGFLSGSSNLNLYDATQHEFRNAGGTVNFAIINSTGIAIANGNLVMSTSGKGIDFSATSSGSGTMTSELLADYEEGTFTPTDGSGAGLSITFNNAKYTKIGRLVYISISTIVYPVTSDGNSARINGLPFTNSAADVGCSVIISGNSSAEKALVLSNAGSIYFYANATTSASTNAQLSNTTIYGLSAVYQV